MSRLSIAGLPTTDNPTQKPGKPYRGFPLGVHPNGQWCKRINGHLRYFGKIAEWRAALHRYNTELPYWASGQTPPPEHWGVIGSTATTPAPGPSLDEVGNRFLVRELKRHERGQLGLEAYLDERRAIVSMFDFCGRDRRILAMSPDDWADLRHKLETEPRKGDPKQRRRGPDYLDKSIAAIRAMAKWAEGNLLQPGQVIRFGDSFDRVHRSEKRKARREKSRKHGERIFTPEQVQQIVAALPTVLKAMFLLGINGGFGAADLSAIPLEVIDLDGGIIDYARVKTGVERTVTLWPRTIEALRAALPLRPKAKPGYEGHAFLTRCGVPFCRARAVTDEKGNIVKAVRTDAVAGELGKVLTALNIKRYGLNFYAARHTFRTHAGGVGDSEAVDRCMGHSDGTSAEWYTKAQLDRLRAVTAHVERALFGSGDRL